MDKKIRIYPIEGGIVPPLCKPCAALPLQQAPLPSRVVLPLIDEQGAPVVAQVHAGDYVKTGQLVAKPSGKLGLAVHASISGTVSIAPFMHPLFGCPVDSIIITSDNQDVQAPPERPRGDYFRYLPAELIGAVRDAGIVGSGATALHEQLTAARHAEAATIIVDVTETEPYQCAESRLMAEYPKEMVEGIRMMLYMLDAFKCVIAVTSDAHTAALRTVLFNEPNIFLAILPRIHPQGFARQLTRALTGDRAVPQRGGAMIVTPAAAIAVSRAIKEGRPAISRAVTVSGGGVASGKNLMVRTGTLISDLISHMLTSADDISRPLMGGSLTGKPVASLESPVLASTNALTFLGAHELHDQPAQPCIRCGACVRVCPEGLQPALLSFYAEHAKPARYGALRPKDCTECGCCVFVCPAHRPIVRHIREANTAASRAAL